MNTTPDFDIQKEDLHGTVLIEASAGTGKTFTLALLVIRLIIEESLDIPQIVAVTFTKAATAELKERIAKFLRLSLGYLEGSYTEDDVDIPPLTSYLNTIQEEKREEVSKLVESALLTIDEAAIFTIHGFCQRLLNDFAFESGAEFGREMITDQSDLIHEIAANFWRRNVLTLTPEEFQTVTKMIPSPEELFNRTSSILTFPNVEVKGIIKEKPDLAARQREYRTAIQPIAADWNRYKDEVIETIGAAKEAGILNGTSYNAKFFDEWIGSIESFLNGFDSNVKRISQIAYSNIKTKGKAAAPEHPFFHLLDDELPRIEPLLASIESVGLELVTWLETAFITHLKEELHRVKEARNQSSFDDIITGVYEALSDKNPRKELFISLVKQRFKAVLVDEFQDTDAQQFEIFRALFGDSIFFMIGDPKQAIYRFRGGDVYAYLEAKKQPGLREFTLRQNFRSEATLIEGLNTIFAAPGEHPFLTPGIPYHTIKSGSSRTLISCSGETKEPVVVWQFDTPVNSSNLKGTISKSKAITKINALMIDEIADLLSRNWEIGSEEKRSRISAGDIAVLVGSHGEARTVKQLLNDTGIPAVTLKSGNIFHSNEAVQLMRILEAVENPGSASLLRAVLYQSPFDYSPERIEKELIAAMTRFTEYHEKWRERGVLAMLTELFKQEELFAKQISSDFEGFRPLTNYRHIFELLHVHECELGIAPLRLIARFRELQSGTGSDELQQRMESDESAVKIVTIHASKGLEYPVVFVPYPWTLTTTFTEDRNSPRRIIHPLANRNSQIELDISADADKTEALREADEEFQRLFYVALTRASQRLYLTSAEVLQKKDTPDPTNPAIRFLQPLQGNSSHIEWRSVRDEEIGNEYRQPVQTEKPTGEVREFTGTITVGDQTRSYSSVMLHPPHIKRERTAPEKGSIFAFPKGARTGNAWHRIFEVIDYTKPQDEQEQGLVRAMEEFGFSEKNISFDCIRAMVQSTLHTTLNRHGGTPFSLSQISKQKMLTEMAFYLKANSVDPFAVKKIIEKHEGFSVSIRPEQFSGYLQGFIDLIFEQDNRYYILDWKSNHLGNDVEDYSHEKLDEAMAENEYRLQFILYTVAVTRFLQETLENFSYTEHMGGAYYVFLRGVNPKGLEGFYYHYPKEEMVMELLDHFCGE